MYDLSKIMNIFDVNLDQVIIKVNVEDPLMLARFPFVPDHTEYITITRGSDHTMTIIKRDATSRSINWGTSTTLISREMQMFKDCVCQFVAENGIFLDYTGTIDTDNCCIYKNVITKWQLNIGNCSYMSYTADSFESMVKECEQYLTADSWTEETAKNGITYYVPKNPKFTLK